MQNEVKRPGLLAVFIPDDWVSPMYADPWWIKWNRYIRYTEFKAPWKCTHEALFFVSDSSGKKFATSKFEGCKCTHSNTPIDVLTLQRQHLYCSRRHF